jgi:hypothetical protein
VKELKQALAHVYWLGGSPCSGKSSIARLLAERYHFKTYHCDDAFPAHQQRHIPHHHPTFQKISQMTWDEIWGRPLPVLLADEIALSGWTVMFTLPGGLLKQQTSWACLC